MLERNHIREVAARTDRQEAEQLAAPTGPATFGEFLTHTWIPQKRRQIRTTTAYRYAWFVDRYIQPAIGDIPLRRLRADHLDTLYDNLAANGGRHGHGLAPKTASRSTPSSAPPRDHAVTVDSSTATWPTTCAADNADQPAAPDARGPLPI